MSFLVLGQRVVQIDYTNYKGERRLRRIQPIRIVFEESAYHPGSQWLLEAFDLDKGGYRLFAMKDIHEWKPYIWGSDA